jgi:hypothetical protein
MLTELETRVLAKELTTMISDDTIRGKPKLVLQILLAEITNDNFSKDRYLNSLSWLNEYQRRKDANKNDNEQKQTP